MKKEKRILIWAIILAIVIHLLIFFFNFIKWRSQREKPDIDIDLTKPQSLVEQLRNLPQDQDKTSLRPATTAPVKFENPPENSDATGIPRGELDGDKDSSILNKPKKEDLSKKEAQKKPESSEKKKDEKPKEKRVDDKSKQAFAKKETLKNYESPNVTPQIEDFIQKTVEATEKQEATGRVKFGVPAKILDRSIPDSPKMPHLLEGFTKFMEEEGNNQYLWRSGTGFSHDVKDAKHITYLNKIIEFFYSANDKNNTSWQQDVYLYAKANRLSTIQTGLEIDIAADGKLKSIKVIEESGSPVYDRVIVDQFKRASAFPPIPKHFKKDNFKFRIRVFTPIN